MQKGNKQHLISFKLLIHNKSNEFVTSHPELWKQRNEKTNMRLQVNVRFTFYLTAIRLATNLAVDFVESILQLSVDSRQLLKVPVGFMDGRQDLVDFIYSLIHGRLWLRRRRNKPLNHLTASRPC